VRTLQFWRKLRLKMVMTEDVYGTSPDLFDRIVVTFCP